jgi:hypothetical protein
MAKKSRRVRREEKARTLEVAATAEAEAAQGGDEMLASSLAGRNQVDFSTEYGYVIYDLRNMAIIAVAMLAILLALALFLP